MPDSPAPTCRDLYNVARRYYRDAPLVLRLLQRYRPYIAPFAALVPLVPQDSTVLDAGCGGGLLLTLLADAKRVRSAYGFDSSKPAIAAAAQAAKNLAAAGNGTDVRFEYRDATAAWPDGLFDVVSLIDVMHHVPPAAQKNVIDCAIAHVRPGGHFLYKDMCARPRWRAAANRMHDLVMARQWIHYCPISAVDEWVASAGLATLHAERINMLWYGHDLRLYQKPAA